MSDPKYVVFNCSRGPITLTFYNQSSFENLSTMTSHHRRRAAKTVFKNVTLRNNCSMDLVAETGLPISELEKNQDLARFIMLNKVNLIQNSERVIEESVVKLVPIPQEIPQEIPKEIKSEVIVDVIIEEVVDPEELRRAILADSMAIEEELLEQGNIFSNNTQELAQKEEKKEDKTSNKSKTKKKAGRPKKGSK